VLLAEFPTMPATVIAERVGWPGSASWFRKKVAVLRIDYTRKDPADRIVYQPGDQAQCDLWFPPARVPLGAGQDGCPPVLVMVASFSRFITGRMIPTRTTADLLAGMWSLLDGQLGAVPRRLVWDNETGIGRGGRLAVGVAAFTGTLATSLTCGSRHSAPPHSVSSPLSRSRRTSWQQTEVADGGVPVASRVETLCEGGDGRLGVGEVGSAGRSVRRVRRRGCRRSCTRRASRSR
jgi:hypothetical protein